MLKTILSKWLAAFDQVRVEPVTESTGLSGAHVWKIICLDEEFCLKSWPQDRFSEALLCQQHRLLKYVHDRGFRFSPLPKVTEKGSSVVTAGGFIWDLTTWISGAALSRPKLTQLPLRQAMQLVAEFHMKARHFETVPAAPSPGLRQRRDIGSALLRGELVVFSRALCQKRTSKFDEVLASIVAGLERNVPLVLPRLESVADQALPLQWCLRDVKHDHVFFDAGKPSGLIDFGAASIESVACDVARLVGSLDDVTPAIWRDAVDAYTSVRALSPAELQTIPLFDAGDIIAAGANWLRWLAVEQRQFQNENAVLSQLQWLANRFQGMS